MTALPRAMGMMTDPQNTGTAVLAFCQDVQAAPFDYPVDFFEPQSLAHSPPGTRPTRGL